MHSTSIINLTVVSTPHIGADWNLPLNVETLYVIKTSSLCLTEWKTFFGLQEEVSLRVTGTSVTHWNLTFVASVLFVRAQRFAFFSHEIVLVSLHNGFGEIFPGSRVRAENCQATGHQRHISVRVEI